MSLKLGHDVGMFVCTIVVEDDMDHLAGQYLALNGVEKADELLVTVLFHATADDRAVQDIECGEQGGGTVANIIVGHRSALAGLEWQAGLGAIDRLDLRLLVDRQGKSVSGGAR